MVRLIPPTLQQLKLFEAVARHGSITRAADEVHLTQPTVSMQVKSLEDKLGLPLTEQIGKQLHLTRAGEEVANAARDILGRMSELQASLEDMHRNVAGPLSVAVVSSAKYFLPQLLGQFKRRYPNVDPRLQIVNREAILQRVADNSDDLFIMGQPPEDHPVVADPFLENVIVCAARPDHPLAGRKAIKLRDIVDYDLIRREAGSGTRKAVDRLFDSAGVQLGSHLEFDDSEAIKQAVISGLGAAFLSRHALRLELAAGELVELDVEGFPLRRRWYAMHRKGKKLSKAAQSFLDFLHEGKGG
jgi:DNA-binding transcriptional LysR family regulator